MARQKLQIGRLSFFGSTKGKQNRIWQWFFGSITDFRPRRLAKGAWLDELLGVLWAYRTTIRTPTGETPFKMTFGTEAVVLVEIGVSSIRKAWYDEQSNEEGLKLALDCLPEWPYIRKG